MHGSLSASSTSVKYSSYNNGFTKSASLAKQEFGAEIWQIPGLDSWVRASKALGGIAEPTDSPQGNYGFVSQ